MNYIKCQIFSTSFYKIYSSISSLGMSLHLYNMYLIMLLQVHA